MNCSRCPTEPAGNAIATSSDGIAHAIRKGDEQANLIILAAHGIVALGATIADAFHIADMAEEAAKTAVISWRGGI